MSLKEAIELIFKKVSAYLAERFTGKIIFTFNCKDGGIGKLSMIVEEDLRKE